MGASRLTDTIAMIPIMKCLWEDNETGRLRFMKLRGDFTIESKIDLAIHPVTGCSKKRLKEAYFLPDKKRQKSTDIYLDIGFENLSHFSHIFKQQFGVTPAELADQKKKTGR